MTRIFEVRTGFYGNETYINVTLRNWIQIELFDLRLVWILDAFAKSESPTEFYSEHWPLSGAIYNFIFPRDVNDLAQLLENDLGDAAKTPAKYRIYP